MSNLYNSPDDGSLNAYLSRIEAAEDASARAWREFNELSAEDQVALVAEKIADPFKVVADLYGHFHKQADALDCDFIDAYFYDEDYTALLNYLYTVVPAGDCAGYLSSVYEEKIEEAYYEAGY